MFGQATNELTRRVGRKIAADQMTVQDGDNSKKGLKIFIG